MKKRMSGVLALALTFGVTFGISCTKRVDDGASPQEAVELPLLTIRDDTPNLLLTWVDEAGAAHVELHPADVPAAGRELVRVVVADRKEGTKAEFYVVDLTKKREDGSYVARTMSRRAWEDELERRRAGQLAKLAPPPIAPQGSAAAPPTSAAPQAGAGRAAIEVIIYGAAWCKPCHQAADFLKKKRVPYVLKDIEEDAGAQAEMQSKLAKTGQHGGSIPVIDVRGQVLVGFSPAAIERALAKAASGTTL
jgi:glutaredoxin